MIAEKRFANPAKSSVIWGCAQVFSGYLLSNLTNFFARMGEAPEEIRRQPALTFARIGTRVPLFWACPYGPQRVAGQAKASGPQIYR